jgi:hypothetical protein
MTVMAKKELTDLSACITMCNIVYLPQLGFFLRIPEEQASNISTTCIEEMQLEFVVRK